MVCVYDAKKNRVCLILYVHRSNKITTRSPAFSTVFLPHSFHSFSLFFFILDYHLALYVVFMRALREAKLQEG